MGTRASSVSRSRSVDTSARHHALAAAARPVCEFLEGRVLFSIVYSNDFNGNEAGQTGWLSGGGSIPSWSGQYPGGYMGPFDSSHGPVTLQFHQDTGGTTTPLALQVGKTYIVSGSVYYLNGVKDT